MLERHPKAKAPLAANRRGFFVSPLRGKGSEEAMKSYHKTFRLRLSMKDGLTIEAPASEEVSRALAFFLRAVAAGVFIWLSLFGLAALMSAIRWW